MEHILFQDYAFYGYTARYSFSNIEIMFAPDSDGLGTLVELKGKECREFENILLVHDETWFDFLKKSMAMNYVVKLLNLAINDHIGILNIPKLIKKCNQNEYVSLMRRFQGIDSDSMFDNDNSSSTLYIGSMKSDINFCIYDKDAEQRQKNEFYHFNASIKNRFEIRLKNVRATTAAQDLINCLPRCWPNGLWHHYPLAKIC